MGTLILCLERGIVFATRHRIERSDARWSDHLPLWKNSEGLSHNENEEENTECLSPAFQLETDLRPV